MERDERARTRNVGLLFIGLAAAVAGLVWGTLSGSPGEPPRSHFQLADRVPVSARDGDAIVGYVDRGALYPPELFAPDAHATGAQMEAYDRTRLPVTDARGELVA